MKNYHNSFITFAPGAHNTGVNYPVILTLLFLGFKYYSNLLPFHCSFKGNNSFITQSDDMIMEWQ
jgi:hypothetical protein